MCDPNILYSLDSFKKWNHSDKRKCSAKKVAEAGFYKVNPTSSKDDVVCFCCFLELDSWEASDNPLEEHKKYLEDCAYVKKVDEKGVEGLSVEDMIDINEARYISLLDKAYNEKVLSLRLQLKECIEEARQQYATKH